MIVEIVKIKFFFGFKAKTKRYYPLPLIDLIDLVIYSFKLNFFWFDSLLLLEGLVVISLIIDLDLKFCLGKIIPREEFSAIVVLLKN